MQTALQQRSSGEQAAETEAKALELESRKGAVITEISRYVQVASYELGSVSRHSAEELLQSVRQTALDEKDISNWEKFCYEGGLASQESSARQLYESFESKIFGAFIGNLIGKQQVSEWYERFRNPAIEFPERKQFVEKTLPGFIRNWEKAKQERIDLQADPRIRGLNEQEVKNLAVLFDADKFRDLSYHEKRGLLDRVSAALTANEHSMEETYAMAAEELEVLSGGPSPCLHPSKVGTWLKRIFRNCKMPAQVETFLDTIVRPYAANWRLVRDRFDAVTAELAASDKGALPASFKPLTPTKFLLKSYEERETYLEQATLALRQTESPDSPKRQRLKVLKVRMKKALAAKDPEEARVALDEARALDPKEPDLDVFAKAIESQAADEQSGELTPEEALQDMRTKVQNMHPVLRTFYGEALERGSDVFTSFAALSENRIRKHEVDRLLTTAKEMDDTKETDAAEQTDEWIAEREETDDTTEGASHTEPETLLHEDGHVEESTERQKERAAHRYIRLDQRKEFLDKLPAKAEEEEHLSIAVQDEDKPVTLGHQKQAVQLHQSLKKDLRVLEQKGLSFSTLRTDDIPQKEEEIPVIDA